MADLATSDFTAYFEAVHGSSPFPWQRRLLEQVEREGRWPSLLDLPTGAGKTAAIDVALFHLALDAARPAAARRAPRRIVMVVDRRTVVDQAFERAQRVARSLSDATDGVLSTVRERLRLLSDAEAPLACAQLRGGMPRDDSWARRPDQPVVAISTVDQVGSRLLFRGYGVSDAMRPVHAGLLGSDTLVLLDEVHLSRPFLETLESLRLYQERTRTVLPCRWQFVAMSATPDDAAHAFRLDDADRSDARLARRLQASKPVDTEVVKGAVFAEACAKRAGALLAPGRCVAVVVNRVATALDVFRVLRDRHGDARVFLVTGRMRPLDRSDLEGQLVKLVSSARERSAEGSPVVVVATQCIEAGADFDFDALITECASLDALRQRFGRLNRLGLAADAGGAVVVRSEALGKDATDPIYGEALAATWRWLEAERRDFGISRMSEVAPTADELRAMLPPASRAPVMLPAHLDAWAQTNPAPRPDPDISLWLHGADRERDADVQIVWRADFGAELLVEASKGSGEAMGALLARLDACPPSTLEAVSVPIGAARAWLSGSHAPDVGDVEGLASSRDVPEGIPVADAKLALSWRGEQSEVVTARELRPGMTLVVPSSFGGLTFGTWDPGSKAPVEDLGDRARWQQTRRATLRLHPALCAAEGSPPEPGDPEDADDDVPARVKEWLGDVRPRVVEDWKRDVTAALLRVRRLVIIPIPGRPDAAGDSVDASYLALAVRGGGVDATTEDDASSNTGVEVTLDDHMMGVGEQARRFAVQCGLGPELTKDLEIAGRWHDAGKVDPRFQSMLLGGTLPSDDASKPLAKSRIIASDRNARMRARERSRYPRGARHELSSVSLLEAAPALLREAVDRDLVLHLVASHHGWCRPFAPVVDDREPVDMVLEAEGQRIEVSSNHGLGALDSGVAERFWRLTRRYGWHGLAWLEAILRLADHRRSEWEQNRVHDGAPT